MKGNNLTEAVSMPGTQFALESDENEENSMFDSIQIEEKEPKDRMALYISRPIAREFKKVAIDEGVDYSNLAELVFTAFLKSKQKI